MKFDRLSKTLQTEIADSQKQMVAIEAKINLARKSVAQSIKENIKILKNSDVFQRFSDQRIRVEEARKNFDAALSKLNDMKVGLFENKEAVIQRKLDLAKNIFIAEMDSIEKDIRNLTASIMLIRKSSVGGLKETVENMREVINEQIKDAAQREEFFAKLDIQKNSVDGLDPTDDKKIEEVERALNSILEEAAKIKKIAEEVKSNALENKAVLNQQNRIEDRVKEKIHLLKMDIVGIEQDFEIELDELDAEYVKLDKLQKAIKQPCTEAQWQKFEYELVEIEKHINQIQIQLANERGAPEVESKASLLEIDTPESEISPRSAISLSSSPKADLRDIDESPFETAAKLAEVTPPLRERPGVIAEPSLALSLQSQHREPEPTHVVHPLDQTRH